MYVYIITNIINGKKYIGLSINKKKSFIKSYYGSGILIKNAILKYGKNNFKKDIIKFFNNEDECREYERYLISKYNAVNSDMFYNLSPGGYGGASKGRVVSNETRKKISNTLKGRKKDESTLKKISNKLKGRKQSKEEIENRSISLKEYHSKMTQEVRTNINNKISKSLCGRKVDNDVKLKISKTNSKLTDKEVLEVFNMIKNKVKYKEIQSLYNISPSQITSIKNKKTYKWILEKLEDISNINSIFIYDSFNVIKFKCSKNFNLFCIQKKLPYRSLVKSYKNNGYKIHMNNINSLYHGWYAKKNV